MTLISVAMRAPWPTTRRQWFHTGVAALPLDF